MIVGILFGCRRLVARINADGFVFIRFVKSLNRSAIAGVLIGFNDIIHQSSPVVVWIEPMPKNNSMPVKVRIYEVCHLSADHRENTMAHPKA